MVGKYGARLTCSSVWHAVAVLKFPGSTMATFTLNFNISSLRESVIVSNACFVTWYAELDGQEYSPFTLVTMTTLPAKA